MNKLKYFVFLLFIILVACTQSSRVLKGQNSQITFADNGIWECISLSDNAPMQLLTADRSGEIYLKTSDSGNWYEPMNGRCENDSYVQTYAIKESSLEISYKPYMQNSYLITVSFIARENIDKFSIGMRFFAVNPEEVKYIYCLPNSLPYLRRDTLNKVPVGYLSNGTTFNNTFSLITDQETYSVSILPPEYRLSNVLDSTSMNDYMVGFYPEKQADISLPDIKEGSITLVANHLRKIEKGEVVKRQFLVSVDKNVPGEYTTGFHIGQYMNLVKYERNENLYDIYRKSMDYLLKNSYCFDSVPGYGTNYYGSIHTQTGKAFHNGQAFYAMYGNSFTTVALNQFKRINVNCHPNLSERLGHVNNFLQSDILTEMGAYWSMLDINKDKGYVDQAYRKWIETHATGWVTYYLLSAYEVSQDELYKNICTKTLNWLSTIQQADGSFPKYFDNNDSNNSSQDRLGDIAWVALAFFKAAELGIQPEGTDLKKQALKATGWMLDNIVPRRQYYGSFEDVGGVNDAYCSSISARSFIEAYKQTTDKRYLSAAEAALSVSLSWITCDYLLDTKSVQSWDVKNKFQAAYAHVESTSCYYPCSYTLPALYLAAAELALQIEDPSRRAYWSQIGHCFNHISDFLLEIPESKAKYGMEWVLAPFLVFSEWGNSQLCWSILESYRNRIHQHLPEFDLNPILSGNYKGNQFKLFMPEWEGFEYLIEIGKESDPLIFKNANNDYGIFILSEGHSIDEKLVFRSLLSVLDERETYEFKNLVTDKVLGHYTRDQLRSGIQLKYDDFAFFLLSAK